MIDGIDFEQGFDFVEKCVGIDAEVLEGSDCVVAWIGEKAEQEVFGSHEVVLAAPRFANGDAKSTPRRAIESLKHAKTPRRLLQSRG